MQRTIKLKLVFWGSLLSGIGLCIGGIWLPPLLVPGGILLAAAFGMYQSVYAVNDEPNPNPSAQSGIELRELAPSQATNNNLGVFFIFGAKQSTRAPKAESVPIRPTLELI